MQNPIADRIDDPQPTKCLLPVTLLSGFLGSGKTTLLQHVLRNKEGLRCAVIVNDMAELNMDAELLRDSAVLQREEKLVQLQNGCICCTLRGDLLLEVRRLAESGAFDYLVIESTGISEPMQVAETFTFSIDDADANDIVIANDIAGQKSLKDIARLDTCVTVIDAANFLDAFETADTVSDRNENVAKEDERNVTDLMVDQIEFADVIVLNKMDLVSEEQASKVESIARKLNPEAEIVRSSFGRVELGRLINTHKFDLEKAARRDDWSKSLSEASKPETEEYGIGSFVYEATDRPFHPKRLADLLKASFLLQETVPESPDSDNEEDDDDDEGLFQENGDRCDLPAEQQLRQSFDEELKARKSRGPFAAVLRSKGFIWLASRPTMAGVWSQAGLILGLECGSPWMIELPEDEWPEENRAGIAAQVASGPFGDRKQAIVFIGLRSEMDKRAIESALDACLLTDEELAKYREFDGYDDADRLLAEYDDPFAHWPTAAEFAMLLDDDDDDDDDDEVDGDENQPATRGAKRKAGARPIPENVASVKRSRKGDNDEGEGEDPPQAPPQLLTVDSVDLLDDRFRDSCRQTLAIVKRSGDRKLKAVTKFLKDLIDIYDNIPFFENEVLPVSQLRESVRELYDQFFRENKEILSKSRFLTPKRSQALEWYLDDIEKLATAFLRIAGETSSDAKVRFGLCGVNEDGCQLFHRDYVPMRMVVSYLGPSTEWVADDVVDWDLLNDDSAAVTNETLVAGYPATIRRTATNDVVAMKGYYGDSRGCVHRSPPVEALGLVRVVLKLDVV